MSNETTKLDSSKTILHSFFLTNSFNLLQEYSKTCTNSAIFKNRNKKNPTIFLSHNVPYGILDKIRDKKNVNYGLHFGSQLTRKICFKFKPVLCLAGHMHENPGKKKLGSTTVVNAGYGKDAQVLIDIDEKKGKIKKIEFWKSKKNN